MRAVLAATMVCFVSTLVYCAGPDEGETPQAEAIKANFDKLVSEDKEVKREALLYFGKVDKTFAAEVPLFTASLKDERNPVRAISAYALGKIGQAAAGSIPEVEKLLTDSSATVQKYANRALERLRPFRPVPKKPTPEKAAKEQNPPALRRESVDIDAVFTEFESFSAANKPGKQKGPWPTIKSGAGGGTQRLSLSKKQLAGMFSLLGKQESVDQLIREVARTRALVLQQSGTRISIVLSELESQDSSARYLALVDQLNRIKDEKMKTGRTQITSAEYEKMRGKGWYGDYVSKVGKRGAMSTQLRGATIVCGKYAMELVYSNRPPERNRLPEKKTIRGAVDFLAGLILDRKSSKPGKPQVVPGKVSGRKEAGKGTGGGAGWGFSEKRKLKYEIEYLNDYRFKGRANTVLDDKLERDVRDEARATVIFSAGDSTGSTTALSIEFQHLGLKSGSDVNPGYARYDSGLADSDLGKSRKIGWCEALKDGNPSISVTPGGRITEAKGFDAAEPQHGKLGMVLFGNQFLRAPELPQNPSIGKSWKGSLTLMHCIDTPLKRYDWDSFEVEIPMVFTIRKISRGGEYSIEGVVEPKTTLSMGDPRKNAYVHESTVSGTWEGEWSRDHWKSTDWDVKAAFTFWGFSATLNSRYSATLKK